ncbi:MULTISPECIES: ABC transporter permease [Arthrobacter]|uniref:ABC transporter permease n=1 Tax=Arthrobacter terricola TaxID=2547396 RepID=A0A4R5KJU5_9MICC|nr:MULTISPECIES: ABC transporter permease [Arthrobacter]MBT8162008.1 ABC transporter permease [Arthrobacter sp. GN70]TDF94600.1 ABC transporter permease [Arthrobacter terricola]
MYKFVLRRLGFAALSLWGVATIVFVISKLIPGDVARVAAGRLATADQVAHMREVLGLNDPLFLQYTGYISRLVQGNLGTSTITRQSVMGDLGAVLPTTIQLVLLGMFITVLIAAPVGIAAAVSEGKAADVAARIVLVTSGGVPVFWLAIMMRWILGSVLGWFPISGTNSVDGGPPTVTGFTVLDSLLFGTIGNLADSVFHLILPALALSAPFVSTLARLIRSNMMTALKADYITFAISKGVPRRRVILRHAFRSALGSVLTVFGMQFGWMISAAVLVEAVFGLPGIGSYLYRAIINQDTFSVLASVVVIGFVFIATSFIVDLLQMAIDPRVRHAQLGAA